MSKLHRSSNLSRRHFLKRGAHAAGVLGVSGAASVFYEQLAGAAASKQTNPFAYDLGELTKTDPKLIQYEATGRFRSPRLEARRIAFGADDHLYLAAGSYVSILDRAGAVVSEIALSAPARCVAIAKDSTLYVSLRDHVEVFDAKGQRRARWDSPGKRTWFTGLAAGENDLFAADAGNRVMLRYDRSGKLVKRIGEKNPARNIPGFVIPSPYFDVEIHRDGLLRVTNPGRHRVEAYTFEGDLELSWGKASAAIDGFCGCCNPVNIAILPNGSIVTCEKGLPRVKVYTVDGQFESVVAGTESFPEAAKSGAVDNVSDSVGSGLDAAVDAQGRIYILDMFTAEVRIMTHKARQPA
jgi:hypothetical protein